MAEREDRRYEEKKTKSTLVRKAAKDPRFNEEQQVRDVLAAAEPEARDKARAQASAKRYERALEKEKLASKAAVSGTGIVTASRLKFGNSKDDKSERFEPAEKERWQIDKAILKGKFKGEAWNPRKRVSPDALAGIRSLSASQPDIYNTATLAQHFKMSPEAIRRILKSKWQPSEEEAEDRRKRWEKRGEKKWTEMVEHGIRPPKKWRDMGVGRTRDGSAPKWKKAGRVRGMQGERWIEQADSEIFARAADAESDEAVFRRRDIPERFI